MKKKTIIAIAFLLTFIIYALSSFSNPPESFIETGNDQEVELKISGEYTYDEAWEIVSESLRTQFETEIENKEKGLLKTAWIYPSTGKLTQSYRNRMTLQFSPDRYTLNILLEAEFQKHGFLGIKLGWVKGRDKVFGNEFISFIKRKIGRIG
jgi:hypothetical protein